MFAISEILRFTTETKPQPKIEQRRFGNLFAGIGETLGKYKLNFLRSSIVGTLIGILPGAGGDIAAWVAYAMSKKFSKEPEKYGTGHIEGIVDASSANNAALGGTWVPAMVFGIPGDSITAIIMMFCIVGSFAINNTAFGVAIMLVLGFIAYVMEENNFPIAPTILGIVLGPMLEQNFITSMIKSDGNLLALFQRPIAGVLGVTTLLVWFVPLGLALYRRTRRPAAAAEDAGTSAD